MTFVRVRFRRFIGETLAVRNQLRVFPSHGRGRRFNPYSAHHFKARFRGLFHFKSHSRHFETERSVKTTLRPVENPWTSFSFGFDLRKGISRAVRAGME